MPRPHPPRTARRGHRRPALALAFLALVVGLGLPHATPAQDVGAAAAPRPAPVPAARGRAQGSGATARTPVHGPARGHLVIAGGGNLDGSGIYERFIALAGGPAAKVVIVPTAGGNRRPNGDLIAYDSAQVLAPWKARGLTNVHLLHTHDPRVADTEAFARLLGDATGVWFNGGRQWNLVDSYAGTRTLRGFHDVLARDGVVGGSSAGATIQGTFLVRGAVSGSGVMIAPEPEHQDAFGFLRASAIDQHVDTRNRWNDLGVVMDRFPGYLGLGISEGTAVVVRRDTFEVIGKARVAVHDRTGATPAAPGAPYALLSAGDRYDMAARRILAPTPPPGDAPPPSR